MTNPGAKAKSFTESPFYTTSEPMAVKKAAAKKASPSRKKKATKKASASTPKGSQTRRPKTRPEPAPVGRQDWETIHEDPETVTQTDATPSPANPEEHAPVNNPTPETQTWTPTRPEPATDAPSVPADVHAAATTQTGMPAWAHLGWALMAAGLALATYSLNWAVNNYPDNFNPGGVSGINVGIVLSLLGIVVGATFSFVPNNKPVAAPGPGAEAVAAAQRHHGAYNLSRAMSLVGVGLTALGLVLTAYVFREQILGGGPAVESLSLAGVAADIGTWVGVWMALALSGFIVWLVFGSLAQGHQDATAAWVAASGARPASGDSGTADDATAGGVSEAELKALMRRIDELLATLPDDTVSAFSQTKEADTYLKLLGDQSPPKP